MDAIYQLLNYRLLQLPQNLGYARNQETIANYLTLIMASEFWWRLRCRGDSEVHMDRIVTADSAAEMRRAMKSVTAAAFSSERERSAYEQILRQLDKLQFQRNLATHVDGYRMDTAELPEIVKNEDSFRRIESIARETDAFPVLSARWLPVIPVSRVETQRVLNCKRYEPVTDAFGQIHYLWRDCQLSVDTPEFQRNGQRSDTSMKEGRLYFLRKSNQLGGEDQITSAYPFVMAKLDMGNEGWKLSSVWMFLSVYHRQNGSCRGVDILRQASGRNEIEYIPEIAVSGSACDNIYIRPPQPNCPISNVYAPNVSRWIENVNARNAIREVTYYLSQNAPLVYLYGRGGIGKTATAQKVLEEFDRPHGKGGIHDYLVFLSAKKTEWGTTGRAVEIQYRNGHQSFSDLETLKLALENIFREKGDADSSGGSGADETLFDGKRILLVLDDFETLDVAEQNRIIDYLWTSFLSSDSRKPRQTIITCRIERVEGFVANVQILPLKEEDAANFAIESAGNMDARRRARYALALGEAYHNSDITHRQYQKRKVLTTLTIGLPLLIRQLVFMDPEAEINENTPYEVNLIDYLMRDTYKYLSSGELKRLAAVGSILTTNVDQCSIDRLEYVWDRLDNSQDCSLEPLMKRLVNYGVLWYDERSRIFGFSGDMRRWIAKGSEIARSGKMLGSWMRGYIEKGMVEDTDRSMHLSREGEMLARWLSRYHECSISDCLLKQLNNTVRCWYNAQGCEDLYLEQCHGSGEILNENYNEENLVKDMWQLYHTVAKDPEAAPWQKRSAVQFLVQVCLDFPTEEYVRLLRGWLLKALVAIDDGTPYFMEISRFVLLDNEDAVRSKDFQRGISETLRSTRKMAEPEDRDKLLILWNAVLLLGDCAARGITLYPELIRIFVEMSADLLVRCVRQNLSVNEMTALYFHMKQTAEALDDENPDVIRLRMRMEEWADQIDSHRGRNKPKRLFFGRNCYQ